MYRFASRLLSAGAGPRRGRDCVRRSAEDELDVLVRAEPHDSDQLAGVVGTPLENEMAAIVLPLADD